jgi:hypothetical protein
MTYAKHITVSEEMEAEISSITCTLPGKVFYAENGEVLILADEGKYIISVEPPDPPFNAGSPTTHSAYLVNEPPEHILDTGLISRNNDTEDFKGWTTGWET